MAIDENGWMKPTNPEISPILSEYDCRLCDIGCYYCNRVSEKAIHCMIHDKILLYPLESTTRPFCIEWILRVWRYVKSEINRVEEERGNYNDWATKYRKELFIPGPKDQGEC